VLPIQESYLVIPDPLKRIERLGKSLKLVDGETFYKRYISFKELMLPLFTAGFDEPLCAWLEERYGLLSFS